MTIFQRPQLFERFRLLQGSRLHRRVFQQKITPISVKAQVFIGLNQAWFTGKGNQRTREIQSIAFLIHHHFDHAVLRRFFRQQGRAQGSHLQSRSLYKSCCQGFNNLRFHEGLITLNIDDNIRIRVFTGHFRQPVRSGRMSARGQYRLAAEDFYRFYNAFVIRSYQNFLNPPRLDGLFVYMLNHRLTRQQRQWLPRQPCGCITRRNHTYGFHTSRFSPSTTRRMSSKSCS